MPEDKRTLPAAAFERVEIGEGFIWAAVAVCGTVLVACASLVLWLYPRTLLDRQLTRPLPIYPEPRLQADPAADMREFLKRETAWLDGAGWIDEAHGIAHVPIEQAMRELAAQGLPDWPAGPAPDDRARSAP